MGTGGIVLVALFAVIVVAMLAVLRQDGQFLIHLPGVKFRGKGSNRKEAGIKVEDAKAKKDLKLDNAMGDGVDAKKLKTEGNLIIRNAADKGNRKN